MHFELLQSISLNGNRAKPNDDRCGATTGLAWVIDGATDLGEPGLLGKQGGAAWLASTAHGSFTVLQAETIQATTRAAFERIESQFELQRTRKVDADWEVPKAAFAAVQLGNGVLEVAWAADCTVLQASGEAVRWCTGEPDASTEISDARGLGVGIGADPDFSDAVLANRRAHRGQGGIAVLSTDAIASARATSYSESPVAVGDELILMSDGFASLVTDYAKYSAESLVRSVREHGLAQLAQQIRQIEREDATCLRFPRFKVSDDATALWLKVGG